MQKLNEQNRHKPKFLSICIPTYNRGSRVARQVSGLLSILGDEIEVIIVDNGSTDDTARLLKEICAHDPRVSTYRNRINLGCDVNYLRLIEYANGTWCWLLGDDDDINCLKISELIHRLKTEQTDVVHIVPHLHQESVADNFLYRSEKDFSESFYSLSNFYILPSTLIRVEKALPLLQQAYRACGLMHSYVAISTPLIRTSGLKVYNFGLILPKEDSSNRWPAIEGYLSAWKMQKLVSKGRYLDQLMKKHAQDRGKYIFFLSLYSLLGASDGKFKREHLREMRMLYPPSQQVLVWILWGVLKFRSSPKLLTYLIYLSIKCGRRTRAASIFLRKHPNTSLSSAIFKSITNAKISNAEEQIY